MHVGRCGLLAGIVLLIHLQHHQLKSNLTDPSPPIPSVRAVFPGADQIVRKPGEPPAWEVRDPEELPLGHVVQTSPASDSIIGFSGPTNVLVGFDTSGRVSGTTIISSEDTRDHVRSVRKDAAFLIAWNGLTAEEAIRTQVDAVAGATLTSVAIQQSIIRRLGGTVVPRKFERELTVSDLRPFFPDAAAVKELEDGTYAVFGGQPEPLGTVLRTSPAADHVIGYQGPTDTIVAFDQDGKAIGLAVLGSFDNEPYVRYVREDYGFPELFTGMSLWELPNLDIEAAEIEGVAGATMTSMSVAHALVAAAKTALRPEPGHDRSWAVRDIGTCTVLIAAIVMAFTSLRGNRWVRLLFQCVLIGYLGLINGDMLSQALLVGWAANGIPWSNAAGLAALTVAAFALPMTTGRNVYCSHVCPHGALQQVLRNRLPWRVRLPRRLTRALSVLPGVLLFWVVIVAMTGWDFSLVDIEPFDAWLISMAGAATIVIAVVGLIASAFVPMAYCRFGCPTGALLGFVRRHRRSDRFASRDAFAVICVLVAVALFLIN